MSVEATIVNNAAPFVGRCTLPNADVCKCISVNVGSPLCTDSLNKHKNYLSLCWCVFDMTMLQTFL